jgi:histidinol-phosphate aminotransferase
MTVRPLPWITEIEPYKGGDATLPGIAKPVKLASNENPFGPSPKALAAYQEAAQKLHVYPEGSAKKLRDAIGAKYGLDPARIVCGAGSDEIFFLLTRAFLQPGDEMLTNEHAFSVYHIAAQQSGATTVWAKDRGLEADVDSLLSAVTPKTKMLFLANPNNPTGTYLSAAEIKRLHAGLPEHVLFVLDAAYAEFVRKNDYAAGVELAGEAPNVLMTRTFSKIYGLASARLGWGFGPAVVIDAINRVRGPFNVSTPSMIAGIAALEDETFVEKSVAHNLAELERVANALRAMGLEVTPSVANFLLVHFKPGQAAAADAHLRSRGYIMRGMKGYRLPDALRFSMGLREENDGALAALAEFMKV